LQREYVDQLRVTASARFGQCRHFIEVEEPALASRVYELLYAVQLDSVKVGRSRRAAAYLGTATVALVNGVPLIFNGPLAAAGRPVCSGDQGRAASALG